MTAHDLAEIVFPDVLGELEKALDKFPTWPVDPLHALAVLSEEYGEVAKAMLELTYEPSKITIADARLEVAQMAAMAVRLMASLEEYVYQKSPQYKHGEMVSKKCP